MYSRSRRDRGAAHIAPSRRAGPLSSSTDTSGSSSRGVEVQPQFLAPPAQIGVPLPLDSLKDFKERVDSTIQQLSGLVSLLTSREVAFLQDGTVGGGASSSCGAGAGSRRHLRQQQSNNTSNLPDDPPCCGCRCHADGSGCCQATLSSPPLRQPTGISLTSPPPLRQPTGISLTSAATRRQARSLRDLSAANSAATSASRKPGGSAVAAGISGGDNSDGVNDLALAQTSVTASGRRKATSLAASAGGSLPQQPQHHQSSQRSGGSISEPLPPDSIRFLWYDASRKRYSVKEAELICSKSVKRLHLSVHYFRVAGEDLLLLEKDCNDDGLAFLDVDSVVAFEGLSVEKVLKLQKLGCHLRPEDLSREFAVEKGRNKFYVVPVEEADGEWRICDGAGAQKLDTLKRVLEQQELRRSSLGGGGARRSA